MKVKVVKISPSIKDKRSLFVDVELPDAGILIKGCKVKKSKMGFRAFLPSLPIESDDKKSIKHYTPIRFLDEGKREEFLNDLLNTIKKIIGEELA